MAEYVSEEKRVNRELDLKVLENSLTNIWREKSNFDIKAVQLVTSAGKYFERKK
jgi:hypothetical protein